MEDLALGTYRAPAPASSADSYFSLQWSIVPADGVGGSWVDWRELERWLSQDLYGVSGELAYRTALRAVPLAASQLEKSWASRQFHAPLLLASLRGMLTTRAVLTERTVDLIAQLQDALAPLAGTGAKDYSQRSARALMLTLLAPDRAEQRENLRRTIQISKDVVQNVSKGWQPKGFSYYGLDIWKEIERDVAMIGKGNASSLPKFVVPDRREIKGAWDDLIDHIVYYDQNWGPWSYWLEYRLFGASIGGISDEEWARIERQVAMLPSALWADVPKFNKEFEKILLSFRHDLDHPSDDPGIEPQNPLALLFQVNQEGQVDLDRSPSDAGERITSSPVYDDLITSLDRLIESCDDNVSSYVKEKAKDYRSTLVTIDSKSSEVIFITKGESLRIQLSLYEKRSEDSDVPPIKDSTAALLKEVVGRHNILLNLDAELAALDRALLPPGEAEHILSARELDRLMAHPTTGWLMTPAAQSALRELIAQANADTDAHGRVSRRTSESGKNLVRSILQALYRHKKAIGVTIVAMPPALYALGRWALANESTLLHYFPNSPGMHHAIETIMRWLHTLPLN